MEKGAPPFESLSVWEDFLFHLSSMTMGQYYCRLHRVVILHFWVMMPLGLNSPFTGLLKTIGNVIYLYYCSRQYQNYNYEVAMK